MKQEECNHEINITNEEYISNKEIKIVAECSLCKSKFYGIIEKDD